MNRFFRKIVTALGLGVALLAPREASAQTNFQVGLAVKKELNPLEKGAVVASYISLNTQRPSFALLKGLAERVKRNLPSAEFPNERVRAERIANALIAFSIQGAKAQLAIEKSRHGRSDGAVALAAAEAIKLRSAFDSVQHALLENEQKDTPGVVLTDKFTNTLMTRVGQWTNAMLLGAHNEVQAQIAAAETIAQIPADTLKDDSQRLRAILVRTVD